MEDKLISYGGQALMEGVLMRGRKACAVAMRAPDGKIVTKVEALGGIYKTEYRKDPFPARVDYAVGFARPGHAGYDRFRQPANWRR